MNRMACLLCLVLAAGCGGGSDEAAYRSLQDLHERVRTAPAPMLDDEADEAVHECLAGLSRLADVRTVVEGEELRLLAARATFQVAAVMLHRHHDAKRAKVLLAAARDIFTAIGTVAATAQARVLDMQIRKIDGLFGDDTMGRDGPADGTGTSGVVAIEN